MKVLFDQPCPFLLAHGGAQIQMEQTMKGLLEIGVEVEWLRSWDESQSGDIIHYFGRPSSFYIELAQRKGIKVVMSELLTGLGSRPASARRVQKLMIDTSRRLLPEAFTARLAWDSYRLADAVIALTPWEKQLMMEMFEAPAERVHVIPNGVEEVFFLSPESGIRNIRSDYLVCTATITERKRVLELAEAAIVAQTPLWVVGKPYAESDPYHERFLEAVKRSAGIVRYEGGISDRVRMAEIYQSARGFVLLSTMESLSLSALEAAASGCPLLLSDLPWARSTFGSSATYCRIETPQRTAESLRAFYQNADAPYSGVKICTWRDVALLLADIYRSPARAET